MPGRAVVLADAAPGAGLGHLARSTALAQALAEEGVEARCAALGAAEALDRDGIPWAPAPDLAAIDRPGRAEVVVLDSYRLASGEVRRWAGETALVAFWDEGKAPEADLIISLALEVTGPGRALSGLEFACLGREYWRVAAPPVAGDVDRVLVSVRGPGSTEISRAVCEITERSAPSAEIVLVVEPNADPMPSGATVLRAPPSLAQPLLEADLAITSAGQTMLEALATGTPCIALPTASNQRPGARLLSDHGAAILAEPGEQQDLRDAIRALVADSAARQAQRDRGRELVDGRGALRVATEVARLAG